MNEGFGKAFYRKGNSVKRLGPWSRMKSLATWAGLNRGEATRG